MAAYCLFDIREVHDPVAMDAYRAGVAPTVEQFGGEYLVMGGPVEVLEGDWRPVVPVLLKFPSMDDAHRWYRSEEYKELLEMRLGATSGTGVFFEGT
ncbi:MAG: DUF1330 domain-containing protein [Acidimicrobiia bacterium]